MLSANVKHQVAQLVVDHFVCQNAAFLKFIIDVYNLDTELMYGSHG